MIIHPGFAPFDFPLFWKKPRDKVNQKQNDTDVIYLFELRLIVGNPYEPLWKYEDTRRWM